MTGASPSPSASGVTAASIALGSASGRIASGSSSPSSSPGGLYPSSPPPHAAAPTAIANQQASVVRTRSLLPFPREGRNNPAEWYRRSGDDGRAGTGAAWGAPRGRPARADAPGPDAHPRRLRRPVPVGSQGARARP